MSQQTVWSEEEIRPKGIDWGEAMGQNKPWATRYHKTEQRDVEICLLKGMWQQKTQSCWITRIMTHETLQLYLQGDYGLIAAQTPYRWLIEAQVKHTAAQDTHIAKVVCTVSHSPSHTRLLHHSPHPR